MSRFLGSRLTLVGLLVSILVLVIGISVVTGAGSGRENADAHLLAAPTLQAAPITVVVKDCSGTAEFDVFGSGWPSDEVVLITLQTETGRLFVGAGFPGASGGFIDDIEAPVSSCGVLTVQAKTASRGANAAVSIVASK